MLFRVVQHNAWWIRVKLAEKIMVQVYKKQRYLGWFWLIYSFYSDHIVPLEWYGTILRLFSQLFRYVFSPLYGVHSGIEDSPIEPTLCRNLFHATLTRVQCVARLSTQKQNNPSFRTSSKLLMHICCDSRDKSMRGEAKYALRGEIFQLVFSESPLFSVISRFYHRHSFKPNVEELWNEIFCRHDVNAHSRRGILGFQPCNEMFRTYLQIPSSG